MREGDETLARVAAGRAGAGGGERGEQEARDATAAHPEIALPGASSIRKKKKVSKARRRSAGVHSTRNGGI